MKSKTFSILKFIIGWPFSIIALVFILKKINLHGISTISFSQIHIDLFFYGILSFLIYFFIRSFLWHKILDALGYKISYRKTAYFWATSELKRYIPGNIWSFLGRGIMFVEKDVKKADIVKGLVIEAELLVLGALVIAIISLPFLFQNVFPVESFKQLITILVYFTTICIALLFIFQYALSQRNKRIFTMLHHIVPPFQPKTQSHLLLLSSVSYFFMGIGYYFTIASIQYLDPHLLFMLIGFFVFSFLVGYVSVLTPSGLGIREGVIIIGLSHLVSIAQASFVAVFSRIILLLSEVLFVMISYCYFTIKSKLVRQMELWINSHIHITLLFCLILIYCLYFTTTSFLRYENFYTGRFDLGNMAQTVWNTSHGRIFQMTEPNGTDIVSRLATHADFILILLAPFYTIWPDPRMLLLIQAVCIGFGALFIYLLSNYLIKKKNIALVFAVMYLLNPSIERSNLYDFHAVTLATMLLLGAFYFLKMKKTFLFLLFLLLAALTKEQIWVIVGLFGGYIFYSEKKRWQGLCLIIGGFSLFYFLISYAIPQSLGAQHFALSYYADFGDKPSSIIKNILLSPNKTLATLFTADKIFYLRQIFLQLFYLIIFSPVYIIFAFPDLFINLLSNNKQLHQIYYQYTAAISPFLFISAIYGFKRLKKTFIFLPDRIIIAVMLVATLYTAYQYGPLPGAKEANLDMITKQLSNRQVIDSYLSRIPKRFSVAASNNLGSHLSERKNIYTIPLGIDKADYIALLPDTTTPDIEPTEKALVDKLNKDTHYILVFQKGTFYVFRKKKYIAEQP